MNTSMTIGILKNISTPQNEAIVSVDRLSHPPFSKMEKIASNYGQSFAMAASIVLLGVREFGQRDYIEQGMKPGLA